MKFHGTLSERSVSLPLLPRDDAQRAGRSRAPDPDLLHRLRSRDGPGGRAVKIPRPANREILGVGRLSKIRGTNEAEFALLIADKFQGQGLGTALLDRLLQVGRDEKIARITGDILPENIEMQRVCEKLGFRTDRTTR